MAEQESGAAENSEKTSGQEQSQEQQGDQQTSSTATFTDEQLAVIRETARREAQSDKDRAVNKVQAQQAELTSQVEKIAAMVKKGMTPDQIEDRFLLDELKAERQKGSQQQADEVASTNATQQQATQAVDYVPMISALGLEPTDPQVINTLAANPNPEKAAAALMTLKIKRASGQGTSAGAVQQTGGGGTPSNLTQIQAVTQKLDDMILRGAHPKKLEEAQKELDRLMAANG